MKSFGFVVLLAAVVAEPATAQLTWFADQSAFEAAALGSGLVLKGIEDYEASTLRPQLVEGFDNPLEFGVPTPNGPYPNGTQGLVDLKTQSNNLGNAGFTPSPAGIDGLAAGSTGHIGFTSDQVVSNLFDNGLDLIFIGQDTTAVGGRVVDLLGPQTGVEIMVFDTANALLGQLHVPGDAGGTNFMGVISTRPIGRINMFSVGAEGMDDIQAYANPAFVPTQAVCQDVTVDAGASCSGTVTPQMVDAGSTVDASCTPLTLSLNPPGPYPLGDTMVTLTVTDGCGQSDSCTAKITVTDNAAPVLDCSGINPNRSADPGACDFTMPDAGFDPVAADNCPGVTLTNDFNNTASLAGVTFPIGATPVVWTATDAAGLTDTCTVHVTITDDQAPTLDCPGINPNRSADPGACDFTMPDAGFDPVATDNCPGLTLTNDFNNTASLAGATFPVGATPVVWTATDAAGLTKTCMVNVTITGDQAPTLDCTGINPNRSADGGACDFTMPDAGFDPVATDNCPGVTLTNDLNNTASLAGATFPIGATPVVWTATDAAGLTGTCTVNVTITDVSQADDDGDGVVDHLDNCPTTANADQADSDGDGIGDVCDDATTSEPPVEQTTTGGCGCGSGIDGIMVMPMTLLGMGWMRRRQKRQRRTR